MSMDRRPYVAHAARSRRYRNRRCINRCAFAFATLATLLGMFWLSWILLDTAILGASGLFQASTYSEMTPAANMTGGGLANAIAGSLVMVLLATLLGTPVGALTGVYLSEYGRRRHLAAVTRFVNDILLSAPSIIIGLFVYAMLVVPFGGFSGWAGAVALALIVIPVVVKTTENMLRLVPDPLREAAYALGASKWKVVTVIVARAARAGVATGVLLALARISGETAPLLFTALSNQFWNLDPTQPMASLPVTIFKFAMSPFRNWQQLAWSGVLIITIGILVLNIATRWIMRRRA
ncbi:MAG: phosphate ABC transporter permease PstA [Xanthomonadaceae bacterium]|jgi:phosphate transport system permease protein|nr:phosphate ABC transporter permease PstA [Xanthomonadaceae bacterium]